MLDWLFTTLGYGLCHQLPERSLFAGGYQLPVCARDTGIYLGFVASWVMLLVLARGRRPAELPRWPVLLLIGAFVGSMAFDGITSYAGLRSTTNDIRLLTGMLTGWGLAAITLPMVNSQLWARAGSGRTPAGARETGLWLVGSAASFAAARWVLPATGVVYPLLVSGAIVATFVIVNLVFVGLMPPFERRATRLRDLGVQILIALALSAAEIGAAGMLRVTLERIG